MANEGPAPKKNFKPVEKRPTGADQFYADHQSEYDQRALEQNNIVYKVHQHNNAYPKLHDELKKRDSIIKVTTISASRFASNEFDPSCRACAKILTLRELRRKKIKPRCKNPTNSNKNKRAGKNACVGKNKVLKPNKYMANSCNLFNMKLHKSNIWQNKSCQCIPMEKKPLSKVSVNCSVQASKIFNNEVENNNSVGLINPDPEPSMSSYNSFMSMDHEPMVDKSK